MARAMTDAELVRAAQGGDARAFTALVRRHADAVYAFLRSRIVDPAAAEDAAQEVFIAAHKGLGSLEEEERPLAWLFGIARKKALDHGRALRRAPAALGPSFEESLAAPPEAGSEGPEALLADLMTGLPDEQRIVALLRFRDGLGYREIAARLGLPPGTVATHLHRARERLMANHERRKESIR